ncbi:MAG: cobalamin-binding protein [Thermoprotei archaeon]|nr:MAG: cobalamin-binding protein [Thermoprotei archaeon]
MTDLLAKIRESVAELDLDQTLEHVREALERGVDVVDLIEKGLAEGMRIVGEKYESGEYFIADLIVSAEIFNKALSILKPKLEEMRKQVKPLGTVVIGTVYGDIHDIGKNLVATMLRISGFEVVDLGVDVPPEKFVESVKKHNADIVGISTLLTSTMTHIRDVVEALKKAGLRDRVKVIVGGAPLTEEIAKELGADAYGENAVKAVEICKKLLGKA